MAEQYLMSDKFIPSNKLSDLKVPNDKRKLQDIVKKANQTVTVNEGGFMIPAAFLMFGIAILSLALQEFYSGKILSVMFLVGFSIVLLTLFTRALLRRRTPFFILTPQGLETSVFQTPLPWRGIKDFQINATKSNAYNITVVMEFEIDEKYLPALNPKCRPASYYDEKRKTLKVSGLNFRLDMGRDKLNDLINDYRLAALAEQKLAMRKFS